MSEIELLIIIHILVGILFIILGIPLILEKVKPNKFYGFRLKKTLSDKKIWYKANKYVGKDLINSGLIIIIVSLIMFMIKDEIAFIYLFLIEFLVVIIPVIAICARAMNYLKKL